MSLAAHVTLLRFLQECECLRLGATRLDKADGRIIVTRSGDVGEAIARGRCHEDRLCHLQTFDGVLSLLRAHDPHR